MLYDVPAPVQRETGGGSSREHLVQPAIQINFAQGPVIITFAIQIL